jgi:hypothetical protein
MHSPCLTRGLLQAGSLLCSASLIAASNYVRCVQLEVTKPWFDATTGRRQDTEQIRELKEARFIEGCGALYGAVSEMKQLLNSVTFLLIL